MLLLGSLAGVAAGVAANTAHMLIDQETEDSRRARTTEHLQAVVRVAVGVGAIVAPLLAAADRAAPHRQRQLRLRPRRGRLHADAGRRAAAAGRRARSRQADDRTGVPLRQRPARRAARRREPVHGPRGHRLLHRRRGRRRGRQVHPGRGARRVDPRQGPRGRRHPRARRHAGRQAAALDPAGLSSRRDIAPRGGAALRRRPRRARRHGRPARPGARRGRHLRPLHRLLRRLPGRGPRPGADRDRPDQPLGDRRPGRRT